MSRSRKIARTMATVLLAGPWARAAMRKRVLEAFGLGFERRAERLVNDVLAAQRSPYPPHRKTLENQISDGLLGELSERTIERLLALRPKQAPPQFKPLAKLKAAQVPQLATTTDLARWLGCPINQLDWFTDERRTLDREQTEMLHQYDYHWRQKRAGTWRLIEAPKPRMKAIQRRILDEILNRLPAHDAAHGFIAGRTCANAAAKHAGEQVVITVDLRDFFLSTPLRRVHAIFRCLGYPHAVARALTSLCSTSTPRHIGAERFDHEACRRHLSRHLPQGAPTSPALANLAALSLDRRLTGLASRFDARYTRYADDLTFSGDEALHAGAHALLKAIDTIVRDESYALNRAKTRIMPRHTRQTVTGIVVNEHINVARPDFDALKATLTNCARHGAASQNRDGHHDFRAHLDGRIAWVERLNLRRGEKLRRLFDAIDWQH